MLFPLTNGGEDMSDILASSSNSGETAAPREPKYTIGQQVRIISESHGWAGVRDGDEGIVIEADVIGDVVEYKLDAGSFHAWRCKEKDITSISADAPVESDARSTQIASNYMYMHTRRVSLAQREVDTLAGELADLRTQILQKRRDMESMRTLMRSKQSKASHPVTKENATRYAQYLLSRYTDITFNGMNCIAITKKHSYTFKDAIVEYDPYRVEITPTSIKITNAQEGENSTNNIGIGYIHPNIESHGNVCWGSYSGTTSRSHAEYKYLELLYQIAELINTAIADGAYADPRNWATDIRDRCSSCYNLDCTCDDDDDRCESCERLMDNCECDRCPSSNEILEGDPHDDYCKTQCTHWHKEDETCRY